MKLLPPHWRSQMKYVHLSRIAILLASKQAISWLIRSFVIISLLLLFSWPLEGEVMQPVSKITQTKPLCVLLHTTYIVEAGLVDNSSPSRRTIFWTMLRPERERVMVSY